MNRSKCNGYVSTLRDQLVLFTGRTHVDGEFTKKEDCWQHVITRGGNWAFSESRAVTLLVIGDLSTQRIIDQQNNRSGKVIFVANHRTNGHHICAIDDWILRTAERGVRGLPRYPLGGCGPGGSSSSTYTVAFAIRRSANNSGNLAPRCNGTRLGSESP